MKIEAKCIMGHKFTMTAEQIKAAQELGVAICPTCGNIATVQKISGKPAKGKP